MLSKYNFISPDQFRDNFLTCISKGLKKYICLLSVFIFTA